MSPTAKDVETPCRKRSKFKPCGRSWLETSREIQIQIRLTFGEPPSVEPTLARGFVFPRTRIFVDQDLQCRGGFSKAHFSEILAIRNTPNLLTNSLRIRSSS
jgi:hypothetical protein